MMPIVLSSIMPLPLLLQDTSGSQRHLRAGRSGVSSGSETAGQGFGHESGPWATAPGRATPPGPGSSPGERHSRAAGGWHAASRLPGDQCRDVWYCAGRNRLLRLAPTLSSHRVATATANHSRAAVLAWSCGALPLPASALGDLKPCSIQAPQPIPTRRTGLRRQIGQDQHDPCSPPPSAPAGYSGAGGDGLWAIPVPCQAVPGSAPRSAAAPPRTLPVGRNVPPVLMRKKGCQPKRVNAPKQQRALQATIGQHETVHDRGTARTPGAAGATTPAARHVLAWQTGRPRRWDGTAR